MTCDVYAPRDANSSLMESACTVYCCYGYLSLANSRFYFATAENCCAICNLTSRTFLKRLTSFSKP